MRGGGRFGRLAGLARRLRDRGIGRSGQGLVEYGLILALTTMFTVVILGVFGSQVADVLGAIGTAIDAATGGS